MFASKVKAVPRSLPASSFVKLPVPSSHLLIALGKIQVAQVDLLKGIEDIWGAPEFRGGWGKRPLSLVPQRNFLVLSVYAGQGWGAPGQAHVPAQSSWAF